jgi:tryptophan 2,3-dioxygenase
MSIDPAPPPTERRRSTYELYLHTDELLSLQKSPEHLLLATSLLQQNQAWEAAPVMRRAVSEQGLVTAALRQLELIAPRDFLRIRTGLGNGSGGESPGFRGILGAVPDLWDAFAGALNTAGLELVDLYLDPHRNAALYECAETLTDFDEQFHLFRAAHLKLAQRHLGLRAIGTGGTPMAALEKTLQDLLFPKLWEARDELLARSTGQTTTDR